MGWHWRALPGKCAASGVLLKHISLGKTVAIVDLTAGEMGTFGTPDTRRQESFEASKILGIQHREQLSLPDGAIENNEVNRLLVIQAIRKYQPEIVLANAIKLHANRKVMVFNNKTIIFS